MMRSPLALFLMLPLIMASGCSNAPPPEARFSWEFYRSPGISPETFSGQSIVVLPAVGIEYDPTQEIYRETLAGLLYSALKKYPEGPRILSLGALQSGINSSALGSDLLQMYGEYQKTAVLRKDILSKVGRAVGARYVILPRLLRFQSETFDRATMLGISIFRTRQSNVDIHAQIWDTTTGEAIWQGASEGAVASEVVRGRPASFMAVATNACESLASRMPWVLEE
jgi:hypothetical protein